MSTCEVNKEKYVLYGEHKTRKDLIDLIARKTKISKESIVMTIVDACQHSLTINQKNDLRLYYFSGLSVVEICTLMHYGNVYGRVLDRINAAEKRLIKYYKSIEE